MEPSLTNPILTHEPFIDGSFFPFTDGLFFENRRRSFQEGEECCIGSLHSEITFPPRDLNTTSLMAAILKVQFSYSQTREWRCLPISLRLIAATAVPS